MGVVSAFVCTRRGRRANCSVPGCANPHDALCDYPVTRKGKRTTCSAKVCNRCRVSVAEGVDHCPAHARLAALARGSGYDPKPGDHRVHIATDVDVWVVTVTVQDGKKLVTFARQPPDVGGCTHLQTVGLEAWIEKTKAPAQSVSPCKGCGLRIEWRRSGDDKLVPVDRRPHPYGNLVIDDLGRVLYAERGSFPVMYLSHFATCVKADQFRRPR